MSGGRSRRRESLRLERSSGVLLHPTSLPGGRFGPEACRFVDWLVDAGQSFWQVLPLGPPDAFESPYAGSSAFAGWSGLLADPEARVGARAIAEYRRRHAYWIDDWLEHAGDPDEAAMQVRFEREWTALRKYANERGVRIIGDLPLYVARESVDVDGSPGVLRSVARSGRAPGSLHQRAGQLWGNPTYRWPALRQDGYRWWIERFRRYLQLFDLDAARSLPRLRLVLGRAVRQPDGEARALAPRPGHGPLRHRPGRARRPCP